MQTFLKRTTRDPLVHFLAIGAALFGIHGMVAMLEPEGADESARIVVTAGEVERLGAFFERRRMRPPTPEELAGLADEYVREEVLYREALALELDRDDAIIRRLMRQKYEFLVQDLAVPDEPDRAELAAWYEAERERYRTPPRLSFTQLWFDTDRRGAGGEQDAKLVLASLRGGTTADALAMGDGQLLDAVHRDLSVTEIAARFGEGFAEAVGEADPGDWFGPVSSGYGLHLIRVDARTEGALPPFEAVERQIRSDWMHEERRKADKAMYDRLLERYEVVLETGEPAAGAGVGARP